MDFIKPASILLSILLLQQTNCQDLHCRLQKCEPHIFNHTSLLRSECYYYNIRLQNMSESTINAGVFLYCLSTKMLDMSRNRIKEIKSGAFLGLNHLTELYLSHNEITAIEPGTFQVLSQLEVFAINGNQLTTIPEYEFTTTSLKYFNLNNNKIRMLPQTLLKNLNQVQLVDLSMNELVSIHPLIFNNILPGVTLILSNNKLQSAAFIFNATRRSDESILEMSGNIMKTLKFTTLGDLYLLNLVTLDMSFNYIDSIEPGTFNNYQSIKTLLLSHNRLQYLDNSVFIGMDKLNVIDLSYNHLTSKIFELQLPATIGSLNYSNNNIDTILNYYWVSPNPVADIYLDVSSNKITNIDTNRFCEYITSVSLSYNNWRCSILYSVVKNLERRNVRVYPGAEYKLDNVIGIPCDLEMEVRPFEPTMKKFAMRLPNKQQSLTVSTTEVTTEKLTTVSSEGINNCVLNMRLLCFILEVYAFKQFV